MAVYEERLTRDLDKIQVEIAGIGKLAVKALRNSVKASLKGDIKLANKTVINDNPINRKKKLINELCYAFLAVHQPSGAHLREIAAIMGIVDELERIGDYAVTIARNAIQLPKKPSGTVKSEVKALMDIAQNAVEQAVTAFIEHDVDLARETVNLAVQGEGRSDSLFEDLIVKGKDSGEQIQFVIDTLTISHQLKRAADRAKNICEETIFANTGEAKKLRILNILFLDHGNDCQSQIAEAVARRAFPRSGEYKSAGRKAAKDISPGLREFMDSKGLARDHISLDEIEPDAQHAAAFDLVISLKGEVEDYFPGAQPYRTLYLVWDVGEAPKNPDAAAPAYNTMYQQIGDQIRDLMTTMRGKEAG